MESGDKRRLGIRIAIFCSPAIGAVLLIVIIVGLVGGVADFVYDSVTSVLTTPINSPLHLRNVDTVLQICKYR